MRNSFIISLRVTLLVALLFISRGEAFSWTANTTDGEINYVICITGYGDNAKADSAICVGPNENFSGSAIRITSEVNFTYTWKDNHYQQHTRNLTAPVFHISNNAFRENINLKSVSIPNSVKSIGNSAFEKTKLVSVSIPNSVDSIGNSAFAYCYDLESVSIGSSVRSIGNSAFESTSLENVSIPNSVERIGDRAFSGCRDLTNIIIPNSVKGIGSEAFYQCTNLTKVILPNTIDGILDRTFCSCERLVDVNIPEGVEFIGEEAFAGTKIHSFIIPSSLKRISYDKWVSSPFDVGDNLEEIIWNAKNCILDIPYFAYPPFSSSMLGAHPIHIIIGSEVQSIDDRIFEWCFPNEVICYAVEPPAIHDSTFDLYLYSNAELRVPSGSEEAYRYSEGWKNFYKTHEISGKYVEMEKSFYKGYKRTFSNPKPIGVTADGASRMYIYFDYDIQSVLSYTVTTEILNESITDKEIIGDLGTLKLLSNGKYGFEYCAPALFSDEFSYGSNSYTILLKTELIDDKQDTVIGTTSIKIIRPGVMLIHGLFSDLGCFNELKDYLLNYGGYDSYQIVNCNYEETHSESFVNNTFIHKVIKGHMDFLYNQLEDEGIISSKYDLIGHSMGGILSRLYAQEVNTNSVNRIITLDTPHSGSHLADLRNGIVFALSTLVPGSSIPLTLLNQQMTNGKMAALENLSTNSEAILRLNDPDYLRIAEVIPCHAISSCTTIGQQNNNNYQPQRISPISFFMSLPNLFSVIVGGNSLFNEDNQYEWLKELYDGDNDCVVSHKSQSGGLSGNCLTVEKDEFKGFLGWESNASHCKTNKWYVTYENIKSLLHNSISSPSFSSTGFHPINLSSQSNSVMHNINRFPLKLASETSFINLTLNPVESTHELDVCISTSEDIVSFTTFAFVSNDKIIISNDKVQSTFLIPDNYMGNLKVFAVGRNNNDEIIASVDSIEFSGVIPLYSLYFEDLENTTMSVGQSLNFKVLATWYDSVTGKEYEDYIIPNFSASKEGILAIDNDIVEALKEGRCRLVAEYKGLICSKEIRVKPEKVLIKEDVNGDGEVNIADINAVIDMILSSNCNTNGDVNNDGEVNLADINVIINMIQNQ